MGNGSSQSIVLGPPRPLGIPLRGDSRFQRGFSKYADPQNRVLPNPVAGQRLRCTDNGNFLHNVGTIRGQRRGGCLNDDREEGDPEMMEILRKRSEQIDKEQDCYHQLNLRNHRLFHSDPDIARTRPTSTSQESLDPGGQRKSGGGAAMRASKLRYRKKTRAPEPPSANSLPRQFERRPQPGSSGMGHVHQQRNAVCRCINNGPDWRPKNRAPPPPPIAINHPPPPPPLPESSGRTVIGQSHEMTVTRTTQGQVSGPAVTRLTDSRSQNYEKNIHPLSKWRNSRSVGDMRIEEEEDPGTGSRTTVFDSRAHLVEGVTKKPSLSPLGPDPFQKEIEAVVKKIAENRQQSETKPPPVPPILDKSPNSPANPSPKQYYFSDPQAFKMPSSSKSLNCSQDDAKNARVNGVGAETSDLQSQKTLCDVDVIVHATKEGGVQKLFSANRLSHDEKVPPSSEFQKSRGPCASVSPYKNNLPTHEDSMNSSSNQEQGKHSDWDVLHDVMLQKQENESDIDIRLRPVLPRKTFPISKFSPVDAWQALGSDGGVGSSTHSTSEGDEGSEPIRHSSRPTIPRWNAGKGARSVEDLSTNRRINMRTVTSDAYHWTPRQDLAEDSDASSINSEDAVLPRNHGHTVGEFPPRFSLPTVMFSNMRPIGTEIPSNKIAVNNNNRLGRNVLEDTSFTRQKESNRKKNLANTANSPVDVSTVTNIKRFLGIKNKFLSEEDVSASDSNWTFGKYALQKNGKHYSSDIMLAKDKKNYEIIVQNNFSDLLGDILVSKASDLKQRMRASDSDHSNFSFYSTEGHVVRLPHSKACSDDVPSPPTKGRVYHTRRKPDYRETQHQPKSQTRSKKKVDIAEREMERKRGHELVRILEEEVRRRRNKEKITIRQQLQMLKRMNSEDDEEDEDFDDEAYFTEPKSLDGTPSPQYLPSSSRLQDHHHQSEIPLSHWKSSPALLEDPLQKGSRRLREPSSSSITSSPELTDNKTRLRTVVVDSRTQQNGDRSRKKTTERQQLGMERSSSDHFRYSSSGRPSQQPSPVEIRPKHGPGHSRKEKGVSSVYKQLMDIVRREERHMKKERGEEDERVSRDSSYSQRESSLSTTSSPESETTSSSSSYSGSAGRKMDRTSARSGIPANNEFHHASLDVVSPPDVARKPLASQGSDPRSKSAFQLALVQPFSPNKIYRPVPFDMIVPGANSACKRTGLKDEGQRVTAQAS